MRVISTTQPTIDYSGSDTNTTATTTIAGATYVFLPPANGIATTCTVIGDSGSDNNTKTTATATGSWSDLVINNEFTEPSECGTYIECTACLGRGVNNGRVPSRKLRPFDGRRWIEHMINKGHKEAVQNILADREKKIKWGGRTKPP